MKFKLIAFVLTLTIASWAQTASPSQTPEKTSPETKGSCCDKTASGTTATSHEHKPACMHAKSGTKDGKEIASCCSEKNDASCCKGKDGKSCAKTEASAGCCGDKCSSAGAAKDCCSDGKNCCADKDGKKTAHNCCGAGQCPHNHHEAASSGY